MARLKPGDKITIKADPILGTDAEEAKVLEVYEWGYIVEPVNDPEWEGPVDLEGNPLQDHRGCEIPEWNEYN